MYSFGMKNSSYIGSCESSLSNYLKFHSQFRFFFIMFFFCCRYRESEHFYFGKIMSWAQKSDLFCLVWNIWYIWRLDTLNHQLANIWLLALLIQSGINQKGFSSPNYKFPSNLKNYYRLLPLKHHLCFKYLFITFMQNYKIVILSCLGLYQRNTKFTCNVWFCWFFQREPSMLMNSKLSIDVSWPISSYPG